MSRFAIHHLRARAISRAARRESSTTGIRFDPASQLGEEFASVDRLTFGALGFALKQLVFFRFREIKHVLSDLLERLLRELQLHVVQLIDERVNEVPSLHVDECSLV